MRGVKKPWPPRNVAPAGNPARTLRQLADRLMAEHQASPKTPKQVRSCFDNWPDKDVLRDALRVEQHALCIYCERPIGTGATRIEHWRPLATSYGTVFDWLNLYLSCPTDDTCDAQKGKMLVLGEGDEWLPLPTRLPYETCVGFTSEGEIYVRSDAPLTDEQRQALERALGFEADERQRGRSTLNLNHPSLCVARKQVLDSRNTSIGRKYAGRRATRAERTAEAESLLAQAERPMFVSIQVHLLNRTLGAAKP